MDMITVTKLADGGVSYTLPGKTLPRKWVGEGAKQKVSYDELEQCMLDPAIKTLFDGGYLWIEDKDARELLNLEGDEYNTPKLVLSKAQLADVLYNDDFETFKEKVNNMAENTRHALVQVAITSNRHAGYDKYDFIRKEFKVDVETVQRQRREEENEKKEG